MRSGRVPEDRRGTPLPLRLAVQTGCAGTTSATPARRRSLSGLRRSLEVVRRVTPEPGKTAAHVEFDRYGRYALVSIWEDQGALVVYDAATFTEVKRIPMSRPSGKYNVWNKITFSDGTSH